MHAVKRLVAHAQEEVTSFAGFHGRSACAVTRERFWAVASMVPMALSLLVVYPLYQGAHLYSRAIAVIAAFPQLLALWRTFMKDMGGEPARLLQAIDQMRAPASMPAQPRAPCPTRPPQQWHSSCFGRSAAPLPAETSAAALLRSERILAPPPQCAVVLRSIRWLPPMGQRAAGCRTTRPI